MLRAILYLMIGMVAALQQRALADWPGDSYALPRPINGCPTDWKEGMRYQDSENVLNVNRRSKSYHLSGSVSKHGIRQEFCTKDIDSNNSVAWPSGQYCIYKYGPKCPQGLTEGWIFWDDENDEFIDAGNLYRGYIPAGIYEKDTLIYTCCKTDGDKKIPMSLPTSMPFYLLAYASAECQQVTGANVLSEFVEWDDEDKGNRNDNSRTVPYAVTKNRWNTKIYYCYYQSSACGANGASCKNTSSYDPGQSAKSVLITNQDKKSELPGYATTSERGSGLAVAIGGSVAATIFGSAALAYVVRQFLNKKAKDIRQSQGTDSEDEEEVFPMPDEMW